MSPRFASFSYFSVSLWTPTLESWQLRAIFKCFRCRAFGLGKKKMTQESCGQTQACHDAQRQYWMRQPFDRHDQRSQACSDVCQTRRQSHCGTPTKQAIGHKWRWCHCTRTQYQNASGFFWGGEGGVRTIKTSLALLHFIKKVKLNCCSNMTWMWKFSIEICSLSLSLLYEYIHWYIITLIHRIYV